MTRSAAARWWLLAGLAVFAVSAARVVTTYLVGFPGELWQLDLEVYRDGAASLVGGRPVYEWLTGVPLFLPFTYPPFAALVMTPLLLVPFPVAGWLWALLQVGLLWVCAGIAFRPFLGRWGERRGLAQGLVAAVLVQLQPVQDGIRFGQVNSVVVTLCLVDVARRSPGWWPRGSLVGLAAAVKLTPATFWVHFAVAGRRRELVASVGAAAAATLFTAAVSPSSTVAYWTDALLDPARLGPNGNVSNQSIRGALIRLGPSSTTGQTLLWVALAGVAAVAGFWLSARLDRLGEPVAVVAAVGMVAVLVSPVSWIHHWQWGIVVIGALLGDGRGRRRVGTALAATVVLALKLPWWGGAWPGHGPLVTFAGRLCEQAYTLFAALALVALWWVFGSDQAAGQPSRQHAG